VPGNGTRRQWGWHPLRRDWARRIVDEAGIAPGDLVLDLGAGHGVLTEELLTLGARVLAVELHPGRADRLRRRYAANDRVRVVRTDLRRLRLPRERFRVVSSPPYSLSSAVIGLLTATNRLHSADLVLQRAVARRLADEPPRGRHGRAYQLDVVRLVPRSAFRPPPRVDSAVLRISRR
jgi:23S rRNA (adenine-N6)-dimethyltransferase